MPSRLHGIAAPSDPVVSPDGTKIAYVVTTIDVEGDRYVRDIWLMADGEHRRFTTGGSDASPQWSPDGRRLAFVRKVDDHPQLAVIEVDGGEAEVVTSFPLGVAGRPAWSPDGSRIAVVGVDWTDEWADLDDEERARRPRRITRRDYRADGIGWTHDRRRHVYVIDLGGETEPRRVTDGEANELAPIWSPNGAAISFLTDLSDRPGYQPGADIVTAPAEGGTARPVAPRGSWHALAYDADGVLHAIGNPGLDFPELPGLWRLEEEPRPVVADAGRGLFSLSGGPDRFGFDGGRAYVPFVDSGRVAIAAVDPTGEIELVVDERAIVTGFDRRAGTTAYTLSSMEHPARLVVERADRTETRDEFGDRRPDVIPPQHFEVDGLDVWVYLPPGDEKVPLLLNIHGGPAAQYGWGYFDEFQVYAAAGYGVVATNPRGSGGRDRDFLRAVMGEGWGTVDVEDIDTAVAAALERFPRLDPQRMGVMGGSYGGFLTAWLIAHQDRWKAAIVERALLSWPSFGGTSDIGGWFAQSYLGDPELEWDRSPLRLASQVRTPTLIIHSENDFRCPIEQAEQYFDALLRNGVEAEFVRFPGEGHELTRSGKPRHREERFDIVLDWLERKLKTAN